MILMKMSSPLYESTAYSKKFVPPASKRGSHHAGQSLSPTQANDCAFALRSPPAKFGFLDSRVI
jgi:hypothetical protein